MDRLFTPPPPQDRKPKRKPKSIFEDDALLIEKCREFLQLRQEWQGSKASGDGQNFLFPSNIAAKLKMSQTDAKDLIEFALSPDYGEFEADYIRNTPHISLDHDGNEMQRPFGPFEGLRLCTHWRANKDERCCTFGFLMMIASSAFGRGSSRLLAFLEV